MRASKNSDFAPASPLLNLTYDLSKALVLQNLVRREDFGVISDIVVSLEFWRNELIRTCGHNDILAFESNLELAFGILRLLMNAFNHVPDAAGLHLLSNFDGFGVSVEDFLVKSFMYVVKNSVSCVR